MITLTSLLFTVHFIGLSLGLGAATVKLVLLYRCRSDHNFVGTFFKVIRPITKTIIIGLILITLSGIAFLFTGYGFSTKLIVKIVLVVIIWILGPYIDNVLEPKLYKLAPLPGQAGSPEFASALNKYIVFDTIAGALFYVIVILWVLFI